MTLRRIVISSLLVERDHFSKARVLRRSGPGFWGSGSNSALSGLNRGSGDTPGIAAAHRLAGGRTAGCRQAHGSGARPHTLAGSAAERGIPAGSEAEPRFLGGSAALRAAERPSACRMADTRMVADWQAAPRRATD